MLEKWLNASEITTYPLIVARHVIGHVVNGVARMFWSVYVWTLPQVYLEQGCVSMLFHHIGSVID